MLGTSNYIGTKQQIKMCKPWQLANSLGFVCKSLTEI